MAISTSTDGLLGLSRLLQLASPALPLGGYAWSHGLEQAVEAGWLRHEADVAEWLSGLLAGPLGRIDAPILARLHRAWTEFDAEAVGHWNAELLAFRESAELRAEDREMGRALARLLPELGVAEAAALPVGETSLACAFALATARFGLDAAAAVHGYLWAWLENQALCAVKLVPLGQTAGQRLLFELAGRLPALTASALALDELAIGAVAPALALASMRHETQYTRLFRS
jgi:urease accessory protein